MRTILDAMREDQQDLETMARVYGEARASAEFHRIKTRDLFELTRLVRILGLIFAAGFMKA